MIHFDPRGGSNKYKVNLDFFKKWTNEMAYVLGFLYADGNVGDSAKSSRTNYFSFSSKDKEIIEQIRLVMGSNHPIDRREPRLVKFSDGRLAHAGEVFRLRIGSRRMFVDLLALGLIPRKSKVIDFPDVPKKYLGDFVRGYFDGDGCVHLRTGYDIIGGISIKQLSITFTSGSKEFLLELNDALNKKFSIKTRRTYESKRAYQLKFYTEESIQLFERMYENVKGELFLKRKFDIFCRYFILNSKRVIDNKVCNIVMLLGGQVAKWQRRGTANPLYAGPIPALALNEIK